MLKECVFQPQQGKSTRAQALPGSSPPALATGIRIKVKLVPHSAIFHESKEARKQSWVGTEGRPIALVVKPIICGFRVIRQLYINLILLIILLIITIIT